MSDTNPKHTPMSDLEFEQYAYYGSESDPSVAFLCAEARRARDSEAALKARVAELERLLWRGNAIAEDLVEHHEDAGGDPPFELIERARALIEDAEPLLSPRDGAATEPEPEYCAHCNRIDVPGYHQSDCPAADDGEAK